MKSGIELAKLFHDTYERLAPQFGYETRPDTKAFSPSSPNGQLMTAVCQEVEGTLWNRVQALEAALAYLVNAHDVEPDRRGVLVDVPNALSKARQLLNERATSETKGEPNA